MKGFSEKLKEARESLDMSQAELAQKVGLSQRSITAYENENTIPRGTTIRKLARVLNVSIEYLMNDEETDPQVNKYKDAFMDIVRENYGSKGTKEAEILLAQNKALFASDDLSQEAKDTFFEAVMVAYVTSKEKAKKFMLQKERE